MDAPSTCMEIQTIGISPAVLGSDARWIPMSHKSLLQTTYSGIMHCPEVILTVLESSKDVVEQVNTPHTHHLHTTTTHHSKKVCLENTLKNRILGVLLDSCVVMRYPAI